MKIRRYLGKNTQEAILKVKMDLGSEALILNTRKVRQKGLLNIFSKPMVEVLAAVDEYQNSSNNSSIKTPTEKINKKLDSPNVQNPKESSDKLTVMENKISNLENMLSKLFEQSSSSNPSVVKQSEALDENSKSNVLAMFHKNLINNDVESEIANKIVDMADKKIDSSANFNSTASALYSVISDILGKPEPIKLREDGKPTVVIFVGPTGVGKTTTLAKIAANYLLNKKKNIGLITADTYRIAAVEQLRTYGEILGIPLSIVYSTDELKNAVDNFADKDIILIDTAGHSNKDKTHFDELKKLVEVSSADEVFLVLSTTSSMKNIVKVLEAYEFLNKFKIIFTKMDETSSIGFLLNTRVITNANLSYITIGQNVPDDIEVADVNKITKNLLRSTN